jgi:hypothetical protein
MLETEFEPTIEYSECLCGCCPECDVREFWDNLRMKPWTSTIIEKYTLDLSKYFS